MITGIVDNRHLRANGHQTTHAGIGLTEHGIRHGGLNQKITTQIQNGGIIDVCLCLAADGYHRNGNAEGAKTDSTATSNRTDINNFLGHHIHVFRCDVGIGAYKRVHAGSRRIGCIQGGCRVVGTNRGSSGILIGGGVCRNIPRVACCLGQAGQA